MSQNQSKWSYDKLEVSDMCRECREVPPNLVVEFSSGDRVCASCGLVLEQVVDTRAEWRTISGDGDSTKSDPNRIGSGYNPFLAGEELHTKIGAGNGSASSAKDLTRAQNKVTRVAKNDRMREAFDKVDSYCVVGKLNALVVENAKELFSTAYQEGIIHSLQDEWIFAVIYHACKRAKAHAGMKEVARLHGGPAKKFSKQYHKIQKFLLMKSTDMVTEAADKGEDVSATIDSYGGSQAIGAKDILPKFCAHVGLPYWSVSLGGQIADAVSNSLLLASCAGPNVATSALYLLCHLIGVPKPLQDIYPLSNLVPGSFLLGFACITLANRC